MIENSNSNSNRSSSSSSHAEGAEEKEGAAEEPSFSEWRIQVGLTVSPSKYYYPGSDFRNHDSTGEESSSSSSSPSKSSLIILYMELFRQVSSFRKRAQLKIIPMIIVRYVGTFVMIKIMGFCLGVAVGVLARAIGDFFLERICKTLDSQVQALVDERRDEFLEAYGIELGYHHQSRAYTWRKQQKPFADDDSHVWLRPAARRGAASSSRRQKKDQDHSHVRLCRPGQAAATPSSSRWQKRFRKDHSYVWIRLPRQATVEPPSTIYDCICSLW